MIRVGITGQEGFIGQHLYNFLGLFPDEFKRINYIKDFFEDEKKLNDFVSNCDVIVHLAAVNRHHDPSIIYNTNIELVKKLISSLKATKNRAHILFSSSSQEKRNNEYGRSKKKGRELLANWAKKNGGKFTGMVIPNVFGPFGDPHYNSFIATFSYQLTHGHEPVIDIDGKVKLIYVGDLLKAILNEIRSGSGNDLLRISHTDEYKVSEILALLINYKAQYLDLGIIPSLDNSFQINLFNTFRSYLNTKKHFPVKFTKHVDSRGTFVEIVRLNVGGQISFSTTVPEVTRGNHFHTRKIERFAVIKGRALIQLRQIGTDEVLDFYLSGIEPSYVDMPVWYTHNIKNIGDEDLYTIFWINEFFDPHDSDTFFESV